MTATEYHVNADLVVTVSGQGETVYMSGERYHTGEPIPGERSHIWIDDAGKPGVCVAVDEPVEAVVEKLRLARRNGNRFVKFDNAVICEL